jgi:3-oxoacyl-[acyl-carrier-protein] synthase II
MGIVCAAGNNSPASWRHVQSGRKFLKPSTRYPQLGNLPVGEVTDLDLSSIIDAKSLRRAPLFVRYAMAAAHEAYGHANLGEHGSDRTRLGASIGTAHGSTLCYLDENPELPVAVKNGTIPRALAFYPTAELNNLAGGLVSLKLRLQGPLFAPTSGMLTGVQSIVDGYQTILSNDADLMVCGATDTPLAPLGVAGYQMAELMSEQDYVPYAAISSGFFLGEGACAITLENRQHAIARGAEIFAEIAGYAFRNCPIAKPSAEDWYVARRSALHIALERAGLSVAQLSSVRMDAWALKPSDDADLMLLADLEKAGFCGQNRTIKPQIGLTLGASSIMETWAGIQSCFSNRAEAPETYSLQPQATAIISSDVSGAVSVLILKTHEIP